MTKKNEKYSFKTQEILGKDKLCKYSTSHERYLAAQKAASL